MKIQRQISFTTSKIFLQQTITCLVFIVTLTSQQAFAQVFDSFTDENFTADPAWSGDTTRFIVTAGQLKLQAPAVGSSAYLSTVSEAVNDASWEFWVRLNFNPSGTNYTRVYLMSDQADLGANLNGYFVLIGDTPDEVSLYRQTGATRTKIINGSDGRVNLATVVVKIKVTRDASGNWNLYSDVGATGLYVSEGSTQDATVISSSYMGVYCLYTATRSDKFLFDDFVVSGNPFQDVVPPVWQSVEAKSAQTVELIFNENLDAASAENVLNYSMGSGIGHPLAAELHVDAMTVTLSFAQALTNGESYLLTTSGVKDADGNVMTTETKTCLYFEPVKAHRKDIIIAEIFADPQPVIGLPDAEYVEIFNRIDSPFDLGNWTISDGSSVATLPKYIIKPSQQVILTASSNVSLFDSRLNIIGVSNFPTLNNSGDILILKDATGVTIDSVNYADTWYLDEDKKQGGWSLELIDVHNICAEQINWITSENSDGGTPGAQNSVNANKPDVTGPHIISAVPQSETELIIGFNEKLDKELPLPADFSINPGVGIVSISFSDQTLTRLNLKLANNLQTGIVYQITASHVFDCAGNEILQIPMIFGLPQEADSLDIVINEVLFNPRPTGVDFVEIYNRSSKFINLKDWMVANVEDGFVANEKPVSDKDLLIAPSAYLVFTTHSHVVKGEYVAAHEENFVELAALPSMNDDEGEVIISDNRGKPVDRFHYTDKMHSAFIKDEEGVSLERISFENATALPSNWKSASSVSGFATPGYLNSNNTAYISDPQAVVVEPEIFQPIIGQPDFTQIHYRFDHGGFVANVKIYDHLGRVIKELANNEVLSAQGSFRWDGDDQNGAKARVGNYMVWFEVFDDRGAVQTFRKRVVVAGKL